MKLKTDLIIRILILISVLILCFAVYMNGKDLNCNKCEIRLTSARTGYQSTQRNITTEINVKVIDLFDSIRNNYCIITWQKQEGWHKFKKIE